MATQSKVVLYPVRDVETAKALFVTLLGIEPHTDAPFYVGFSVDGSEIGLVPDGHNQGMTGPMPVFDVDDIDATFAALRAAGVEVVQDPTDVGYGTKVAKLRDADGNGIGLRQAAPSV
jgi:predicted enzyme related to lactoylglutathione lyase